MRLAVRNLLFTLVVPGAGAVYAPWWILTRGSTTPAPVAWAGIGFIVAGGALYVACLWVFASVGRGTPGPWDPPLQFVAVGPYRWVRNPIYIAALLVMVGEAWLFLSLPLVFYAATAAVGFNLFVVGYEERVLSRRFGSEYAAYRRTVSRWFPRPPRHWAA